LTMGAIVTINLSAPLLLKSETHLSTARIGWIMSGGGVAGMVGLLIAGWWADRTGDRMLVALLGSLVMAVAAILVGTAASELSIACGLVLFLAMAPAVTLANVMSWPNILPSDQLAVGGALINTISLLGSFIMPYGWGVVRAASSGFLPGLLLLSLILTGAAAIAWVLRRMDRSRMEA